MIITVNASRPEHCEIYPIAVGVYRGHDVLYLENDWMGSHLVHRHTIDGELIADYGKFKSYDEAKTEVERLIREQKDKNINEVTGNGRWGCN